MNWGNKGFTLVELIVVITILAILATIGFVSMAGYSQDARDATKEHDVAAIGRVISNESAIGRSPNTSRLKPLSYANSPSATTVWTWRGYDGLFADLAKFPVDPDTGKPYVLWLITSGTGGSTVFGEVGTKTYRFSDSENALTPYQKVRWNFQFEVDWKTLNFQLTPYPSMYGLIPRWYLDDPDAFEKTSFYLSWTTMYGGGWNNFYLFARDNIAAKQIQGYSNESTVLYESFENVTVEVPNIQSWPTAIVSCTSREASTVLSNEMGVTDFGNPTSVSCEIDKTTGAQSKSSLHIKWLRDVVSADGQYAYVLLDSSKKYRLSLDAKGTLDPSIAAGKLGIRFACLKVSQTRKRSTLATVAFQMTLSPTDFTRVYAYVNSPDPSGNWLSLTVSDPEPISCIFYRTGARKAGDELWFDNHIVEEIP